MQTLPYTQNCRLIPVRMELTDYRGRPVNVETSSFTFRMIEKETSTVKIAGAAAIIEDAEGGIVRYDFAAADVDTAGEYWAWFIQTETSSGRKARYPEDGKTFLIRIVPEY